MLTALGSWERMGYRLIGNPPASCGRYLRALTERLKKAYKA